LEVTLCVEALGPQLSGIGRYTWELCKGLQHVPDISKLRLFDRNCLIDDPARLLVPGNRHPRRAIWPIRAWRNRELPRAMKSAVVHGPNYFLPRAADTGVITVHDLSVFLYPETHPPERVRAFERLFMESLSRASFVITDTETVKNEVVEMFSVLPERVLAIPLGVDPRFRPFDAQVDAAALHSNGLERDGYALCVSTLEPRKKITELLQAWRRLPSAVRNRYPLVLAGASGWKNDRIHAEVERAKSEGWLRLLGFVEEEALPSLYSGARLFLYPSAYEGFGLPPVEAMASGTPVITSDRSCLPEVTGGAARCIDPNDAPAFAEAIEECLTNEQWRSLAVARGIERSRRYSWSRCISDTVEVYKIVSLLS
jgi:alpha-1,3-rhamnosyl/mannosyltransferase